MDDIIPVEDLLQNSVGGGTRAGVGELNTMQVKSLTVTQRQ